MLWDYRLEHPNFHGIQLSEFDGESLQLIGKPTNIYKGTPYNVTEGSQILFKNGYYYLICAENGTGYRHSTTVLRSTNVKGPYEKSPFWPLLTSEDTSTHAIQKAGHGSLIEVGGEWFLIFLCARPLTERGYCQLGRETAMAKVIWEDEWPKLAHGSHLPPLTVDMPMIAAKKVVQKKNNSTYEQFDKAVLPSYFLTLRSSLDDKMTFKESPGYLRLFGQQSLRSCFNQSIIVKRWQSRFFTAETALKFRPENFQQMAGLVCYYNTENWVYLYITYNECCKRRVLGILRASLDEFDNPMKNSYIEIPDLVEHVYLKVEVHNDQLQFFYGFSEGNYSSIGPILPADQLSDDYIERKKLVFTGSMVGVCVQDMAYQKAYADFKFFNYIEN
jgi:xylan 1,4-beta-xylosidase